MLGPWGYRIPHTHENYQKVHKELTVRPIVFGDYAGPPPSFHVYRKNTSHLWVPKFYGIQHFGQPEHNSERTGHDIYLPFNGNLKPAQLPVVQQVIDTLNIHDSTVLCMFPGFGKTICTLYIISQIKKKTLIIVHKEFLLNQWIERIREFLPTAKIGKIQQNIVDIENKDIVIAMLQSLTVRKQEYPQHIFDSLGFVAIDECHRICSKTFSKALFQISTKKMLGLSATPDRRDGLSCVLEYFLGSITKPTLTNSTPIIPHVTTITSDFLHFPTVKYNARGKVNLPNLITQISLDTTRNNQIIQQIILASQHNRKILVLTERRQQCTLLCSLLPNNITGGIYVGGMKDSDLTESNKQNVIFATYSMAAEGYDNKELDTLIMATGRSDIEQIVGRIMRQQNTNHPLIIDFYDNIEGIRQQYYKRLRFYKKKKFIFTDTETGVAAGVAAADEETDLEEIGDEPFL